LRNRKSDRPAAILAELNQVAASALHGGFVTASVALIEGEQVIIANAGHPEPYQDGREVSLKAGLPLGVDREFNYEECYSLLTGKLTFVTDGVIEAADSKRELFGFQRTREISTLSAREIADAARAWGQNDDITVVTVRRSP
jgi:phosphoserine phosphatase RsbU/P